MKLVMTLLVRDESDIVDSQIAYHLDAGVDFVVAIDHRSRDGTTAILESYASAGVLRRISEEDEHTRQGAWQTRMARLAVTEYGADWVINSDADEFWWPHGASLKDVLDDVPDRYGVVHGLVRNFVPIIDDRGSFANRMTVRFAPPAPINDPSTPFRPVAKVAHRGDPNIVVGGGSHRVFGVAGDALRDWFPLEVLHFPLRSRDQCARKYEKTWTGWEENLRGDLALARNASVVGRADVVWERVALGEDEVEDGKARGVLVSDTRLRDALASLAADRRPLPSRAALDEHVYGVGVFDEAEIVRYQRWVDDLTARVLAVEDRRPGPRPR